MVYSLCLFTMRKFIFFPISILVSPHAMEPLLKNNQSNSRSVFEDEDLDIPSPIPSPITSKDSYKIETDFETDLQKIMKKNAERDKQGGYNPLRYKHDKHGNKL